MGAYSIFFVSPPNSRLGGGDYLTPHCVLEYNKSKCEVSIAICYNIPITAQEMTLQFCSVSSLLLMKLSLLYFLVGYNIPLSLGPLVWIIFIKYALSFSKLHSWSRCSDSLKGFQGVRFSSQSSCAADNKIGEVVLLLWKKHLVIKHLGFDYRAVPEAQLLHFGAEKLNYRMDLD